MSFQTLSGPQVQATRPIIAGKKFDLIFCISTLWLICGTLSDAWAHNNIARLKRFGCPGMAYFTLDCSPW